MISSKMHNWLVMLVVTSLFLLNTAMIITTMTLVLGKGVAHQIPAGDFANDSTASQLQ